MAPGVTVSSIVTWTFEQPSDNTFFAPDPSLEPLRLTSAGLLCFIFASLLSLLCGDGEVFLNQFQLYHSLPAILNWQPFVIRIKYKFLPWIIWSLLISLASFLCSLMFTWLDYTELHVFLQTSLLYPRYLYWPFCHWEGCSSIPGWLLHILLLVSVQTLSVQRSCLRTLYLK